MSDEVAVSGDALLRMLDGLGTRMDAGLARIETKLDAKADKVDLARINARLDEHQTAIGELRDRQREDEVALQVTNQQKNQQSAILQKRWNLTLSTALVTVTLFGVLATVLHW